MVRKSLVVALLLAIATPLAAQTDNVWSSKRPDGQAPLGVLGGRTLDQGELELNYRFERLNSRGIWFENDSLPLDVMLDFYPVAPLTLENLTHYFGAAYAPTSDLTVVARMSFSQRQREQFTSGGVFYVTQSDQLGDLELTGLYNVFDEGATRAHLQMGATVPIGAFDVMAETPFSSPGEEALPYDMRPGAGTFAVLPGATATSQNEFGTVGAQVNAVYYFGTNSSDYTPGDRLDGSAWAAYKANDFFSVSGRARYQSWGGIEGYDPMLDPLRDPGNDAFFLEGRRVDMLAGINLYLPEGTRFAGHRVAIEWIFPIHQQYDGPQLGADWGVNIGWQSSF